MIKCNSIVWSMEVSQIVISEEGGTVLLHCLGISSDSLEFFLTNKQTNKQQYLCILYCSHYAELHFP